MEILNSHAALLSNYEVLKLVEETRQSQGLSAKKLNKLKTNLANITYDAEHYLKDTPCADQTPEKISKFLMETSNLEFTKLEKLQILNIRPTACQLCQIIEGVEERFKVSELNQITKLVREILPEPTVEETESENLENLNMEAESTEQ